ncbi:hypothetical protein GB937_008275 [Aspergillus fischeri]|nr:hypothetical protein GB937_008275 [Aspergillus fischeri]
MLCSWDPSVWDDSVQTSPVWPLARNEQVISHWSQEQRRIAQEIPIQGSRFQDNLGQDMSSVIPEACLFDEPCLAGAALMILHGWYMGRDVTVSVSLLQRFNNNWTAKTGTPANAASFCEFSPVFQAKEMEKDP